MSRSLGHRSWLAGLVVVALGACAGEPRLPPEVVARVAGREIAYGEFEGYLRRNSIEREVTLAAPALSRLFDQFLEEEMVRALAVDRGLAGADAEAATALEALVAAAGADEVTDAEVVAHYRAHAARYKRPERVRLSQILVPDRQTAETVGEDLAAGVPFVDLARQYSQEPAALRGGDQGVLTRDDLPPAFADGIFALEAGEHGHPVAADYGFHIFMVTERWPAQEVPLERAAAEIRALLAGRKLADLRERVVEEARRRYNVRVDERHLPFRYQGAYREAT